MNMLRKHQKSLKLICYAASTAGIVRKSVLRKQSFLQEEYSSSGYSREEMINNKDKLYELGGTLPDQHYKWDKKKEAEDVGNSH